MRPAMPVRRQFTGACGAALCVVVLGSPPARAEAQGDPAGGACGAAAVLVAVHVGVPSMQSALLCLVNRERAAAGAPALATSRRLRRAAQGHSDDMVARRYFLHTAPGGPGLVRRVRRTGYLRGAPNWALGEDLGWAEGPAATAAALMNAWMNSPPHKAVMLDPAYRQLGIGIALGTPDPARPDGATVTLDFGTAR